MFAPFNMLEAARGAVIMQGDSVRPLVLSESKVVDVEPEEAKPAVTVQVGGTSDLAGKFAGHFSGRITDGTEAMIYLEEDMTLEVSSNVIDD
jgi:hypothetical protein